jgi:hypothetical protein
MCTRGSYFFFEEAPNNDVQYYEPREKYKRAAHLETENKQLGKMHVIHLLLTRKLKQVARCAAYSIC